LFFNVTDTASNVSSMLMDFRRGNASQFNVNKFGNVNASAFTGTGGVQPWFIANANGVFVRQNSFYGFGSGSGVALDLYLYRDAANTLAQRHGANAQTLRLYGTYTDASNGRRLDITTTTGGICTLTATGNGTGATGNILKLTEPVLIPSSSVSLATNGDLAFEATNNTTLTIRYRGTDGTTRSATISLT
jgi:hypothetical protein